MLTITLYTSVLLTTKPTLDFILLFRYPKVHYEIVYYCSATHSPINILHTSLILHTGPLLDYLLVLLPTGPLSDCILVVVPTDPLSDCILFFFYPQTNYQTVFCSSSTHRPTTRLHSVLLLHTGQLPDCIFLYSYLQTRYQTVFLLWYPQIHYQTVFYCYADLEYCFATQRAHYQTVLFWSATHKPTSRLYTSILLLTSPLSNCILLFCLRPNPLLVWILLFLYPKAHYEIVYYCSAIPVPLTDCILLFCYAQANIQTVYVFCYTQPNYQTVFFCSANHRQPPDCIYLFVRLSTDPLTAVLLPTCH